VLQQLGRQSRFEFRHQTAQQLLVLLGDSIIGRFLAVLCPDEVEAAGAPIPPGAGSLALGYTTHTTLLLAVGGS
jgi:hypothetical protein